MTAELLESPEGQAIRAQSPFCRVVTTQEVALAIMALAGPQAEWASGLILDFNGASYVHELGQVRSELVERAKTPQDLPSLDFTTNESYPGRRRDSACGGDRDSIDPLLICLAPGSSTH